MASVKYQLIIFGASGFVGQLLCKALAKFLSENGQPLTWAIAGRNETKLQSVQTQLNNAYQISPDIVLADSTNETSLTDMCQQTQLVVTTAGPYALIGEPLLKACVESGTDYCDLTGESQWVLQMISKYQEKAEETGARIVHSCGFDCIPSDLGVLFTQKEAQKHLNRECDEIKMRVRRLKGKLSGGTYASLVNLVAEVSERSGLKKALASPYCFCPSDHPYEVLQTRHRGASYDPTTDAWIAPFVMEGINTRTVHRSNALLDHQYGTSFKYEEAVVCGIRRKGRKRASRLSFFLTAFMFSLAVPSLRALVARWFLPKPGEGPSEEEQQAGEYVIDFYGEARGRGTLLVTLTGDMDPGYGSTAKILAQSALSLIEDVPSDFPGGFWTTAAIFGDSLIERLQHHAGLQFAVKETQKH